jgi:beta-1,4-mannosyl-glycoprotein beta-1,4-N-acetylglucosaminyltransferase
MKVFDCFTFYKEFDLLELRLEELWDAIDYFVIAEAGHTHQGQPKPYHLLDEN